MATPFEFKQPVGGKKISWKPLSVGQEIDIEAGYAAPAAKHLIKYMLLVSRVTAVDGVAVSPKLSDLREWDSYDLECFVQDVEEREFERKMAFKKDVNADQSLADLEKAIETFATTIAKFMADANTVLATAKAAKATPAAPLSQP
jgi:hypothetical protein